MYKYHFFNDYSEGAHPNILALLVTTNTTQETGYGADRLCKKAAGIIKKLIKNPNAEVHFVSGGTQANLIVLASLMKSYEAVVSANTGHICGHEGGAIEATGHKIISINTTDGKLSPEKIEAEIASHFGDEHLVRPKVIYISNSTEVGTIYKKHELEQLSRYAKKHNLYLFMDGARLGSALCSKESDLSLADIARLVDVFYIGGTKNGALLGEAIVIGNKQLQPHFRRQMKQRGALLAKGRVLGAQFVGLFTNDLYFESARHANSTAEKLSNGIKALGYKFLTNSTTNQIFPILPNKTIELLSKDYGFYVWSKVNSHDSAIRLVTSWATKPDKIDEFLATLKKLSKASRGK